MKNPSESFLLTVETNPGILWLRDTGHVLVVDEQRRMVHHLRGDEVAVWNWLQLSYPSTKIMQMLAEMQGLSFSESEGRLAAIIKKWVQLGLLKPTKGQVPE